MALKKVVSMGKTYVNFSINYKIIIDSFWITKHRNKIDESDPNVKKATKAKKYLIYWFRQIYRR